MAARSNIDPDSRRNQDGALLRLAFSEQLKGLAFSRPGIVLRYDAATNRAAVQPAPNMRLVDGTSMGNVPIVDVLVMGAFAGGGYVSHLPLQSGDPVMLLFSDRVLDGFKNSLGSYDQPPYISLELRDAVVLPGGFHNRPSPVPGALVLRTDERDPADSTYIAIEPGKITLNAGASGEIVQVGTVSNTP